MFAELDWVPAIMTQAEDRCHRIGQEEPVLIQHLVIDGSLDARIASMLLQKQEILDQALDLLVDAHIPILPLEEPPPEPPKKEWPTFTENQHAAAMEGLRVLAAACDGAVELDEVGFSKVDVEIGHKLAARERLSPGQFWLVRRILPKYRRQLPAELLERLLGTEGL